MCIRDRSWGPSLHSFEAFNMNFGYFVQYTRHCWYRLISPSGLASDLRRCCKIESWGRGIQSFEAFNMNFGPFQRSDVVFNIFEHPFSFWIQTILAIILLFNFIIANFILALIGSNTFQYPGVDRGTSSSLLYKSNFYLLSEGTVDWSTVFREIKQIKGSLLC